MWINQPTKPGTYIFYGKTPSSHIELRLLGQVQLEWEDKPYIYFRRSNGWPDFYACENLHGQYYDVSELFA